jgi:dTDP-4-dehydrorhamnose 3,5-epimerase
MKPDILKCKLDGLLLISPKVFGDERGFFIETYQDKDYEAIGIKEKFVQDNLSKSEKGVLRGLHFQSPYAQGKLVMVLEGSVYDVAVDLRKDSSTFGQWEGFTLNAKDRTQLYVPPGFAHGFLVTSDSAVFSYKCTDYYHPEAEKTLLWNDPDLDIPWPYEGKPTLSPKDEQGVKLQELF